MMRCAALSAMALLCAGAACAQDALAAGVTPQEAKEGFVSLFDGKTLAGWQGALQGYQVQNGAMVCDAKAKGANVYTNKEYANFVLRFEFKLPPGGNNGVGIRSPIGGKSSYKGMEIQILDDSALRYRSTLRPDQFNGSIYGVAAAKRGFMKPVGEWNSEEIVADGSHIKVTLNGTVITDVDVSKIKKTPDGYAHPGLQNKKGFIAWCGHGHAVAFRNVRIKELP